MQHDIYFIIKRGAHLAKGPRLLFIIDYFTSPPSTTNWSGFAVSP